jgi:poly [ADP-ribose] polymerase
LTKKRNSAQLNGTGEDSNKIRKDAQKANFRSLSIPVDEAFLRELVQYKGELNTPLLYSALKTNTSSTDPQVYIDDADLIWDATLNQTVAAQNNNKFYLIQLLSVSRGRKFFTWTRYGRVGERGQSACLGNGTLENAMSYFQRKFKDKSGLKWEDRLDPPKPKKYTFIERNYEEDDEEEDEVKKEEAEDDSKREVESTLSKPLQNLMKFIFNPEHFNSVLASMSYDAKKLPLGKLSDRTLKNGFSILKELSELITDPSLAASRYDTGYGTATENLSNRYFTTIPHVFGRNRPPVLNSDAQIKKEVELLEALTDMDVANEIMKDAREAEEINQLDRQFQSLGLEEMTRLDHKSSEFTELSNYLSNSRGATHHLRYHVIDIFRIERQGENDRFNSSSFANVKSDRRLLWHGSRSTNFGGILSQGLRIAPPEAPVNGYMFGKGVYLADTSSKSANYCCPYNSGNMGLLLLCDAELGSPMLELFDSDYNAGENAKKEGKIATLGQGQSIPAGWKDAGCLNPALKGVSMPDVSTGTGKGKAKAWLQYNEYIVYDVAQIRQRYLFYVHMR